MRETRKCPKDRRHGAGGGEKSRGEPRGHHQRSVLDLECTLYYGNQEPDPEKPENGRTHRIGHHPDGFAKKLNTVELMNHGALKGELRA
ncbi:MAG TPA: hypothetical protein VMA37_14305 [Acetobacteraceae bacterium]|nr:hypothetical protein [Acetobacteraceae bacterium]